jgi:hypothetical protein
MNLSSINDDVLNPQRRYFALPKYIFRESFDAVWHRVPRAIPLKDMLNSIDD